MSRQSSRGRGSNQYADKTPSVVDSAADNARVRKMKQYTSIATKQSALGGRLEHHTTASLTSSLSASLDKQINGFKSGTLTKDELQSTAKEISAIEDAIVTRFPNVYGHAVSEAIFFVKDAKYNPELKAAIDTEGSPERSLMQNYSKVIGDALEAPGKELSLEELPQILDSINEAAIAREQGATWARGERKGEPTLSSRFAALSVFSSRDPENNSLHLQMSSLKTQMNERGLGKIDM